MDSHILTSSKLILITRSSTFALSRTFLVIFSVQSETTKWLIEALSPPFEVALLVCSVLREHGCCGSLLELPSLSTPFVIFSSS